MKTLEIMHYSCIIMHYSLYFTLNYITSKMPYFSKRFWLVKARHGSVVIGLYYKNTMGSPMNAKTEAQCLLKCTYPPCPPNAMWCDHVSDTYQWDGSLLVWVNVESHGIARDKRNWTNEREFAILFSQPIFILVRTRQIICSKQLKFSEN